MHRPREERRLMGSIHRSCGCWQGGKAVGVLDLRGVESLHHFFYAAYALFLSIFSSRSEPEFARVIIAKKGVAMDVAHYTTPPVKLVSSSDRLYP